MKYLIPFFTLMLFWTSCGQQAPQDLASLKRLRDQKKAELKALKLNIDSIEAKILVLEPPREKTRKLVTTQIVSKKDFMRYVDIQASVQSDDVVMATSEVGGRLTSVKVKEGQRVKRGQLIATTDLESVDKQIAELETSLELANDVFERQKRLWDQNIGSEIQFLQAKNSKERLEKSLETVRFQLTKGNVYAPISGVVDQQFLKSGELAGPGTPIVQILNTSKVKVVAEIPESYLKVVRKGEKVTVQFPAINQEREARVSLIGRTINPANRTFTAEINLSNPNGLLKPNLLSIVLINDYTAKDAIVIAQELVQQEVSGKKYVYVKASNEEGAFAKRTYVSTGESTQGSVIITEGLKGGEELIVEGARGLAENELIQVQNTSTGKTNG